MIKKIETELLQIPQRRTRDIDAYNKALIRSGTDVSALAGHILDNQLLHRTYFQVSLGLLKESRAQFAFIEQNEAYLADWWHVDQLTQFLTKPLDFEFALDRAKVYVQSDKPFTRRWGYVLFLAGLQKDPAHTRAILSLVKDDPEYYVQMAEAWLLCDLAVYNPREVIAYIEQSDLDYKILGKAIQKMVDSFRISEADKTYVKSLRSRLRSKAK